LVLLFGIAVAATVGKGIIQPEFSTVYVIFAGLIGAIVWDLITWYFGLPSSSSHALIGGLIGSGLIAGGIKAIVISGVEKTLTFMIVSPMLVLELRLLSLLQCCIFCVRRDLQR
jgi:inorganic phosphate transporter, PiT family